MNNIEDNIMKTLITSKKLITATAFILAAAFSQGAYADSNSPNINYKQKNQKQRIVQGVKSGELTFRETARLAKQQVNIQRKKKQFKSDGTFTKRERLKIHKRQYKASKNIYRKKHNARKR